MQQRRARAGIAADAQHHCKLALDARGDCRREGRVVQTLRLAGCPLAREAGYRASVLKAMPATLQQLDADPVRPNER
mgnify:CR=1 FL=1